MNNSNLSYKILTILVPIILIFGIGGYIYKFKNKQAKVAAPIVNSEVVNSEANPFLEKLNNSLTENEKILLNTSGVTLTKDLAEVRFELASSNAVVSNELKIADCLASPLVLKVKSGSTIKVYNNGQKDLTFGFDKDMVKVPIGGSVYYKIKLDQGLYGYGCDSKDVPRGIGLIFVTLQ